MARSLKKGLFFHKSIIKNLNEKYPGGITFSRASNVPSHMYGVAYDVYNGKEFLPVSANAYMLRQRLGEFAATRAVYKPKVKKKQFRRKKKK